MAELLCWIALDHRGVPNKVAGECIISTQEEMRVNVEYRKELVSSFAFSAYQVGPIRAADDKVHL